MAVAPVTTTSTHTTSTQKNTGFDWEVLRKEVASITRPMPTEDTLDLDWELERLGDDSVDLQIELDTPHRLGEPSADLPVALDTPDQPSADLPSEVDTPDQASVDLPSEIGSADRLGDASVDLPPEIYSPGFFQWAALAGGDCII